MNTIKSIGFLLLLAAGCPVHAADENVNMVMNPSFEFKTTTSSYGNFPLYWSRYTGAAGSFDVVTNLSKQAERSLKLTDSSAAAAVGVWTDPIPVVPGRVYTTRAWGNKSSSSMTSKMYTRYCDESGVTVSNVSVSVGAVSNWTEGVKTTTAPTNASYMRILLYSDDASTGTVYFDCVSLTLDDEMVSAGDFSNATVGQRPVYWSVYTTHAGATQDVQSVNGNLALRLYDASSTAACGAYYTVPAAPDVPYKFSASVMKTNGGTATVYLKFFDSNDTQIAYYSTNTSSAAYTNLVIARSAPTGTAYAKLLCFINDGSTGAAYFDNVSFTENYTTTLYAAPVAVGSKNGTAITNAANYSNTNFWNTVDNKAATGTVKVVLLSGDYDRELIIHGVGNATNSILVEGQTPYAVNYCGTDGDYFVHISESRNMTFRHFHFTADEDPGDLILPYDQQLDTYDYEGVVRLEEGTNGLPTCDIRFEDLSFTDMLLMATHAISTHGESCHDITWDRCDWVTIGYDLYDHCAYNSAYSYNLNFTDCYFQDCAGPYVRYRSETRGNVENCTFISTGNVPTSDPNDRVHWSFIQMCAYVTASHPDEKLGTNFVFRNNSFTYEQTGLRGYLSPYSIDVSGAAPSSEPAFHLVPVSTGAVIANPSASTTTRNSYFQQYFGVDLVNNCDMSGSTYTGCWSILCRMSILPDPDTYWTSPISETPSSNVDLDKLVGLD